jgi:hypothetical protein
MAKKILIGVAILLVLLGAAYMYLNYRNRTLSPSGSESLSNNDLTVSINYSRPSVRGRKVFGTKEEEALQPYGEYWRLGANESTEITFNRDVLFNDKEVKAGTYRIYAFPGAEAFEIGLNTELGTWGYSEPDYSQDVLRTKVPVIKNSVPVEQYTVSLKKVGADGVDVVFDWSDVRFMVPVRKK